ncbi:MAG: hypothetical protein ACREBS_05795 [Nitrososphaerales archaeon]
MPSHQVTVKRAWPLAALSMALFITAVFTSEIEKVGLYFTLALVVVGGFAMLTSAIIRERNLQPAAPVTSQEPADEVLA